MTRKRFKVFTRTWWRHNPQWPNSREPHAGRKHTIRYVDTEEEAREICKQYNATHNPGPYSRKAEYSEN